MFERFEPDALRAVVASQEAARELGRGSIGAEHLLAGLVSEEWFTSAQVLTALGATSSAIRAAIGTSPESPAPGGLGPHLPFDHPLKDVMRRAPEEAQRLGADMVGTGHLLLALLRQRRGRAAEVLDTMGISYRVVDETLLEHVAGATGRGRPSSSE